MSDLRISQLAERSGVPATTLRFYEGAGLLPAGRTGSGYRTYDETAVERLAFIGAAKRLGLALEEIGELLEVWSEGSCAQVRDDLRPRIAARITEAERRAAESAAFTVTLRKALRHLDTLPDSRERCGPQCAAVDETPIACTLTGQDMDQRIGQWRSLLAGASIEPIPGGVRVRLPADRAARAAELAVAEQECCAFFDVRLLLQGPIVEMEVRAPEEAAPLLSALFR